MKSGRKELGPSDCNCPSVFHMDDYFADHEEFYLLSLNRDITEKSAEGGHGLASLIAVVIRETQQDVNMFHTSLSMVTLTHGVE